MNESSDYLNFYAPVARNVLAGRGFIRDSGALATAYPPGFPFLLAGNYWLANNLFIPESQVVSVFLLIAMGISSIFLYLIAQGIWGQTSALISALVWMTYPFTLWLTKQPNSEIPFILFFYASFYLLWSASISNNQNWTPYLISGILIGLAALLRPIAIGVGLVFGLIIWLNIPQAASIRARLFLVTALLLGNIIVVLPWEVWVYSQTGQVIPLSTNGPPSIRDGLTFAVNPKGYRTEIDVSQDVARLMQGVIARRSELQSVGDITIFIAEELKARPLPVLKLFVLKAVRSWYGTDSGRYETAILLIQVIYLILIVLGSWLAWKQGSVPRKLTLTLWLLVFYFWGMTILGLSILRYMVPATGLLFVFIPGALFNRMTVGIWVSSNRSLHLSLQKYSLRKPY